MKFQCLFILLLAASVLLLDCSKSGTGKQTIATASVIGFDPCTGQYTDNAKRGYVLVRTFKASDIIAPVTDTVTSYNLPQLFDFTPNLFQNYRTDYLFPVSYRNKFNFEFTFSDIRSDQYTLPLCTGDIYLAAFQAATHGKQIKIGNYFKRKS